MNNQKTGFYKGEVCSGARLLHLVQWVARSCARLGLQQGNVSLALSSTLLALGTTNAFAASLVQNHSPDVVVIGGKLTYTYSLANNGTTDESGTLLTNRLPSNAVFTSAIVTNGTFSVSNNLFTFRPDRLLPGETTYLQVNVIPVKGREATNEVWWVVSSGTSVYSVQVAPLRSALAGPDLVYARSRHTGTLLKDGRVLVAGGLCRPKPADFGPTRTAEVYSGDKDSFSLVGNMNIARCNHLATMLPNGAVLITGGVDAESDPEIAEVFDPVTDSFTVAASLEVRRMLHSVTILPDGDLILAGGNSTNTLVERLHLEEGTWATSHAGQLREPRTRHVAALLGDGRIVYAGGASASNAFAELFDPRSGDSRLIPTPGSQLTPWAASRGRILLHGYLPGYVSGAEIYDIESNTFLPVSPVPEFYADARYVPTSKGDILLIGGASTDAVDVIDVRAGTCTPAPPLTARWHGNAVVEFRDGRLFVIGGYLNNNGEERRSTEFYAFRLDSDHDGMDDEWELANGLNPARTEDAIEDADGEGHMNLHEYLAGTDPRDPENVLKIDDPLLKDGKMMIRFSTVLGKYYRIEKSHSPDSEWDVLSNSIPGTGRPVEAEDPVVPGAEPCIYRVVLLP